MGHGKIQKKKKKKEAIWIDTYNSIDETDNVTKLEISEILLQIEKTPKSIDGNLAYHMLNLQGHLATGNRSRI